MAEQREAIRVMSGTRHSHADQMILSPVSTISRIMGLVSSKSVLAKEWGSIREINVPS